MACTQRPAALFAVALVFSPALLFETHRASAYALQTPTQRDLSRATSQATAQPTVSAAASPQPAPAPQPEPGFWQRVVGKESVLGLLLLGVGTLIGYFVKSVLERLNARAAARLEFAKDVTGRIAKLADEHYWPLANYAGVVASEFEAHLQYCTYHLLLIWDKHADLEKRLNDIAEDRAKNTFPAFCRLIGLFYAFQFRQGNTYLLTSHAAGETCKRLYNMFVGSLPERLNLANLVETQIEVKEDGVEKSRRLYELPSASFSNEITTKLQRERDAYQEWLQYNPSDVTVAASALRALNELLSHELALLYKDWFRRPAPSAAKPYVSAVAYADWPGVLSEESLYTIDQAAFEGVLLRPLGAAITSQGAEATGKQPEAPDPEKRKSQRGRDLPV